ncbi:MULTISPECIES: biotin synthase BioB [Arsenicicoccus]|uniref:biotin synthase BioB n=1 Tax=Arsenicicoccus TaxID=267408 RepID=UPI002580F64F|nr:MULTISPECIES: biotin synthase BioB [Arsenicicoccus]
MDLQAMATRGCAGDPCTREEALAVLALPDSAVLDLVATAGQVRRAFFGNRVKMNYLVNLKSGLCPEDCSYCSQARGSEADVLKYSWLSKDKAVEAATAGIAGGAARVCLVASGRGPSDRDIDKVTGIVEAIKDADPAVEVCACLGFLKGNQGDRLKAAGVDAYNHNLNTAESKYDQICSTHTYADRVDTVRQAHLAELSACSGFIAGMDETDEDLVDLAFALRDVGADSIPVNFLLPFEGTPMAGHGMISPQRCLKILAMIRFVNPTTEIRMAAGREVHLRTMQPMGLHVANSIFLGDYLTSEGAPGRSDLEMLRDNGFVPEGAPDDWAERLDAIDVSSYAEPAAPSGCGGHAGGSGCGGCGSAGSGCGGHAADEPAASEQAKDRQSSGEGGAPAAPSGFSAAAAFDAPVVSPRRRGAGTQLPANV